MQLTLSSRSVSRASLYPLIFHKYSLRDSRLVHLVRRKMGPRLLGDNVSVAGSSTGFCVVVGLSSPSVLGSGKRYVQRGDGRLKSTNSAKFPQGPTMGWHAIVSMLWLGSKKVHSVQYGKVMRNARLKNPLVWASRDCCPCPRQNSCTAGPCLGYWFILLLQNGCVKQST